MLFRDDKVTFLKLIHTKYSVVAELSDWQGKWVHYSDSPYLKINPKQFHRDPAGIYLFPENFRTQGNWHNKKYKFVIEPPSNLNVLDFAKIDHADVENIIKHFGFDFSEYDKTFEKYDHLKDAKTNGKYKDVFWDFLKERTQGKKSWFNKKLRELGYDAIFDDTDSVFNGETQLILLDPTKIGKVKRIDQKGTGFAVVKQIADYIKKQAETVWQAQVEIKLSGQDRKGRISQTDKATANISIKDKDADPEEWGSGNSINWLVTASSMSSGKPTAEYIRVLSRYSHPKIKETHLTFDVRDFDLSKIKEAVTKNHKKIFSNHLAHLDISHSVKDTQVHVIAKEDGKQIGELILEKGDGSKVYGYKEGQTLLIKNIEVIEEQRLKGVATAMLRYAEKIAAKLQFEEDKELTGYRVKLWDSDYPEPLKKLLLAYK